MKILDAIKTIAGKTVTGSLKLVQIPLKPVINPVEKLAVNALQAALMSAAKKVLRTLLATALLALSTALPQIEQIFKNAAANGDMAEKAVLGAIISGLVGLIALVDRLVTQYAKQKA
jgi:hypothetical protein